MHLILMGTLKFKESFEVSSFEFNLGFERLGAFSDNIRFGKIKKCNNLNSKKIRYPRSKDSLIDSITFVFVLFTLCVWDSIVCVYVV